MRAALAALALTVTAGCAQPVSAAAEQAVYAPAATRTATETKGLKTAIFAGGCYWGVEGVFSHVRGVTSVVAGFHGGSGPADYDEVSAGRSGHAEAVRITYDPVRVRYDQLLRVLFSVVADPTQLNRQGPDTGTQYRSAIIPTSPEQRAVAEAYLAQLARAKLWSAPIVTRIEPVKTFYPGPAYHQDFMLKNPRHPYILAWDVQKVEALKRLFPGYYKASFTKN